MSIQQIHQDLFEELLTQFKRNPDLRIRPRKSNRGNKLRESGYWFLGNDYYLAIGFWKGMNWKTRTPNISFLVNASGNSYLIISTTDSKRKEEFVAERIVPKIRLTKSSLYAKHYEGLSPIEALRTFIKEDWPIINEEITSITNKSVLRLDFDLIRYSEFQKDVKNIEKFRNEFSRFKENQRQRLTYKFSGIHIKKYGPIENLEIVDIPSNAQWV
ncbi:MAG: hypothetical protein ACI9Z3_001354, partial [Roseivirga sp.]